MRSRQAFDWITAYIITLPGKSTAEGIRQRQPESSKWAGSLELVFQEVRAGYRAHVTSCVPRSRCCRLLSLQGAAFSPLSGDSHNDLCYRGRRPANMHQLATTTRVKTLVNARADNLSRLFCFLCFFLRGFCFSNRLFDLLSDKKKNRNQLRIFINTKTGLFFGMVGEKSQSRDLY